MLLWLKQLHQTAPAKRYIKRGKRQKIVRGGSNMTGTNCDLFTHKQSRSYLNHLVIARENVLVLPRKRLGQ
jgi:hypothetical protein